MGGGGVACTEEQNITIKHKANRTNIDKFPNRFFYLIINNQFKGLLYKHQLLIINNQ